MIQVDVAERSVRLPARADSPRAARRLLREWLVECSGERWLDSAELALTELITNVVLHARTDLVLRVTCDQRQLHVAVEDFSPALPAQRSYRLDATTGRGLALVAALSAEHGITPTSTGKVVWFTVNDGAEETEVGLDELLDAWGDDDELWAPSKGSAVTLLGLPPTLWLAAAQQHDAFLRELALYRAGRAEAGDDLAAADRARNAVRVAVDRAMREPREQGAAATPLPQGHPTPVREVAAAIPVTISLGEASSADFATLQDVLDEAHQLACAGQLLVQPALPETIALRDWLCEQVIALSAGGQASAWQGADAEHFAQARDGGVRELDYDVGSITAGADRAIVVDGHNRIAGISPVLAQEIGWDPDELVGRRVVAIVPPTFREAHTAGFTRHLTTGEAHALGVPLELPVLCADGTERAYGFFILADRAADGRPVYVAQLTAL